MCSCLGCFKFEYMRVNKFQPLYTKNSFTSINFPLKSVFVHHIKILPTIPGKCKSGCQHQGITILGRSVPVLVLPLSLVLGCELLVKEKAEVAESFWTGHLDLNIFGHPYQNLNLRFLLGRFYRFYTKHNQCNKLTAPPISPTRSINLFIQMTIL